MVVGKDGRLNVSIAVCVCTGYQSIDSNDVKFIFLVLMLNQIWDLQTATRVHTLYETGKYFNTAVACHPALPLIVAGVYSKDSPGQPLVRFWNSTNYRCVYLSLSTQPLCMVYQSP